MSFLSLRESTGESSCSFFVLWGAYPYSFFPGVLSFVVFTGHRPNAQNEFDHELTRQTGLYECAKRRAKRAHHKVVSPRGFCSRLFGAARGAAGFFRGTDLKPTLYLKRRGEEGGTTNIGQACPTKATFRNGGYPNAPRHRPPAVGAPAYPHARQVLSGVHFSFFPVPRYMGRYMVGYGGCSRMRRDAARCTARCSGIRRHTYSGTQTVRPRNGGYSNC